MSISGGLDFWLELYKNCEGDLNVFKEKYPKWYKYFYCIYE